MLYSGSYALPIDGLGTGTYGNLPLGDFHYPDFSSAYEAEFNAKNAPTGIYASSRGVYGYLPIEGSRYDHPSYNFTDSVFVNRQRGIRNSYINEIIEIEKAINTMRLAGASDEAIGQRVVIQRNSQKLEARAFMSADEVRILEKGNIKIYGDAIGPTPDQMFKKHSDWNIVIRKSTEKDPALNMLLGIQRGK